MSEPDVVGLIARLRRIASGEWTLKGDENYLFVAAAALEQQQREIAGLGVRLDSAIAARNDWISRAEKAEAAAEANAKDAERWNALCELWHASTEFHGTQDEDGRWSLTMIEAVENAWTPGRWTGDTPDDAIDPLVAALAESEARDATLAERPRG